MNKPPMNKRMPKGKESATPKPTNAARMTASKPKTSKPMNSVPLPMSPDSSASIRTEQIDNGFLVHHSSSDAKGNYKHKTVYHPTLPTVAITAPAPIVPAKGAARARKG